ncbi:RNA polymerase sigma factor [Aliifodinibius sp. S!AR15-10]|uniref:RNA polymerase sigma factor n=1 Tax=Aliifodinibius sp. S!AR15-10 TaxID=2950437 RepID=UPI00285B6087|nr:RNA polymerase sigma factor [Aliifodinibius sp. S!AR15-10]MDR8391519.1 RNA polymerase sigma factor [Aliifodinibius sp. S!AR15-10]
MENEQQLIERLKERDSQAFKTLVEEQKDRIYNTCLGFLHNHEDAEDTAQEVFITVFDSIDSFRNEASLATWIYRIAVTKSLELIRYRKRKKRWSFFEAVANEGNPDRVSAQDMFEHPGVALENKERSAILFREIDKLTENQKTAFILHKVEGLAYKEIADVMETSVSAVESLIHRAKTSLRKQLHKFYKDES